MGQGYWRYKTADTHATVDTTGYFDLSNEAVSTYGRHIVNSVVRGNPDVIDVSDVTVGTVTDTD
jgi:hypothetical protein